ncbi:integrase [Phyllobacterium ifriqiyense]
MRILFLVLRSSSENCERVNPHRKSWVHPHNAVIRALGNNRDKVRHTCASRLLRGGIDIRRVQIWLGHQTLSMTMRYAHLATNDLDSCVAVLERG